MKTKIRYGIFESNSSSTHTLSICGKSNKCYNTLEPFIRNGKLFVDSRDFGWEEKYYTSAYTKLQYALVMTAMTELDYEDREDSSEALNRLYETEGFKQIEELIKQKVPGCDELVFVPEDCDYDPLGSIDHQSCENYSSLNDFLKQYDVTLEEFIFNKNIELITDNDNH